MCEWWGCSVTSIHLAYIERQRGVLFEECIRHLIDMICTLQRSPVYHMYVTLQSTVSRVEHNEIDFTKVRYNYLATLSLVFITVNKSLTSRWHHITVGFDLFTGDSIAMTEGRTLHSWGPRANHYVTFSPNAGLLYLAWRSRVLQPEHWRWSQRQR